MELCLREAGWRSEWAGARTPAATIADRVTRGDIAMVAMSASSATSDQTALKAIAEETSRACQASGVLLVMGGSPGQPAQLWDPADGTFTHAAVPDGVAGALSAYRS